MTGGDRTRAGRAGRWPAAVNRTAALLTALAVLGACIGATLVRGSGGGGAPQGGAAGAQQQIDKESVKPLPCERAPEGIGERAMEHVRAIVAFGPRNPATERLVPPGWSRQLDYIAAELGKVGLEAKRDTWTDRRELITFTNVTARIHGARRERIVLACHHDTKCTRGHADPAHNFDFVGANDGGSAVALLLALAPLLKARNNLATIDLVFFDGEESLDWAWNDGARALFGSKRFVKRNRDAQLDLPGREPADREPRIAALVLLDMVGRTDLHVQEETFSTPALRRIVWAAAKGCGHEKSFFQRAESASDDHVPFLDAGIPAVDLIDLNGNPHWHKPTDTIENMSARSLQVVADVVLTMLPEVERTYVRGE